jgi:hypothetical protein
VIALIGVVAIGMWLFSGPESGVKLGNEMDPYALQYLENKRILSPDEELVAYYDATMDMDGTEAAILTTKRVVYHNGGANYEIDLSDIGDIRHRKETLIGDVIEIQAASGKSMKIEIAPLNGGESFLSSLMSGWENAKGGAAAAEPELPAEGAIPPE